MPTIKKPAVPVALDPIVPVQEAAKTACMSLPGIYAAINAGHLKTFLIGRRRFVRESALREWLDFLEQQSDSGKPIVYRPREA